MTTSFQELIDQPQDPAAIRLKMAFEAHIARAKAEAHLKAASRALDDAKQREEQARSIRDELLADLAHRLDDLAEDDDLERAQIALDFATITDTYKPFAVALDRAEDDLADAKRALRSAVEEVARHPLVTPEHPSSVRVTAGGRP
ncbi:MAG: hypothetical protein K2X00_13370 [Nitrospiraceae bacterium]|nr:hypothetical protein [Nitrospiraceae bacterium]OQW64747.1 MAG: hypothetical protein BVN29_13165 [Nitrospira sp. ST-bin5]